MNKTIESLLILRKCEIDENYKCKVCDGLLINNLNSKTILQCKNGHTKCCWESSVDSKDGNNSNKLKCHLCNEEYNSIRDLSNNLFLVDSFTKNIKIHCINSYSGGDSSDDDSDIEGCNEAIKIYQLESHLKQCKFHIVQCKNEQCKLEFKLKDKEQHDEICNYKQIKCTACYGNIFKKDIDEHTNKKCPELLIVCQHCNTLVKNSLVNTHLDSICPDKLISCVYDSLNSGIGTSTIVGECGDNGTMVCDVFKRKDSNYHYSDKHSGTHHHEIISNILSNLNSTVGELNTTVDGLNSTVGGLNSKVTDLQNENNSLKLKVIEQQTRFDLFDLQVTNKINMLSDKLEFQAKVNSFLQPQQQQQQQLLSQQYPIVTSTTTGKLNSNGIGSGISNEPEYYQPVIDGTQFVSVTAIPQYSDKSFEELRFETTFSTFTHFLNGSKQHINTIPSTPYTLFGHQPRAKNAFQPTTTTTTPTPTGGLFGNSTTATPTTSLFGNSTTTTPIGEEWKCLCCATKNDFSKKNCSACHIVKGESVSLFSPKSANKSLQPITTTIPPTPAGGLFGNSTTTTTPAAGLFGHSNSTTAPTGGLFGNSTTTASAGGLFENLTTTAPSGGLFGNSTTPTAPATTAGGLFGGSTTGTTLGCGGLFGGSGLTSTTSTTTPATGLFGGATTTPAATTGGLFGSATASATTSRLFGTTTPAATTTTTTSGLFGATTPATTTTTSGLFGSSTTTTTPVTTTTCALFGSLFGSSTAATPVTTCGLFGSTTPTTPVTTCGLFGSLFGSSTAATTTTTTPATTCGLFGTTTPATTTTTNGLFGTTTPATTATTGGLFGSSTVATTTTTPSTTGGLFGSSTTPTTTPVTTCGLFGSSTTTTTPVTTCGLFGSSTTTTPATTGGLFGSSTTTTVLKKESNIWKCSCCSTENDVSKKNCSICMEPTLIIAHNNSPIPQGTFFDNKPTTSIENQKETSEFGQLTNNSKDEIAKKNRLP